MDKPLRMGRSSEPKVDRAYRTGTNNLFALCRAPPRIQTEPQGSFASGDGPRATSNFSIQNAGQWLLPRQEG
jgi:hypothetical protein